MLYKYVTYDAGRQIIDDWTIGFSKPGDFNDPFEVTTLYAGRDSTDPISRAFEDISAWMKTHIWRTNSAILSLTRSPLNPLMWAHYAAGHSGFVIGFDERSAEFTDELSNLIPVQFGNVIYTEAAPIRRLLGKSEKIVVGETYSYDPKLL